jgi:hypothetical protein
MLDGLNPTAQCFQWFQNATVPVWEHYRSRMGTLFLATVPVWERFGDKPRTIPEQEQ